MPGNRTIENGDSISPRARYRIAVAVADADDPTNTGIPILDTRETQPSYAQEGIPSNYGRNAQINVAAWFSTGTKTATLKVYLLADVELKETPQPVEPVRWVLAATIAVTASQLSELKDLPPGQYKILVTALGAGASLDLLTQFAA